LNYINLFRGPLFFGTQCSILAMSWSNSVPNVSASDQTAAELLQFEYLTLWPWTCVTCCPVLWDSLHKVSTQSGDLFMKCNDFYANTSYHAITLTFAPLPLNVCGRSGVTWS